MAVRSKRLFGPQAVGVGGATIYTCPAGKTAVIKQLSLFNQGALTATIVLGIGGTGANLVWVSSSIGAGLAVSLVDLFMCLAPGETIRAQAGNGTFTVTGSGAELEGVAT